MYNQIAEDLLNSIQSFVDIQKKVNASSSKNDFDKLDELGRIIEVKANNIIDDNKVSIVLNYTQDKDVCDTTRKYVYLALGKE